jgi:membrane fusion protein, multidrug efflux system
MSRRNIFITLILAAGLVAASTACRKKSEAASAGPNAAAARRSKIVFPVETRAVELRSLVYSVNAVGSVDAFEKVQVTARVAGVVDRVLFSEGSFAKLNQILVEIEPERYTLAVEVADASYQKAMAAQADAEAGLKRRETVITQNPGLIPGEEVETWRTKVLLAKSDVAQTKAALNQAKLNLHDAYVRAPSSGILQTRTVQTGQYVDLGSILATLVRRDPLLLRFKVPERDAARIKVGMSANFKIRNVDKDYSSKIVHVAESADDTSRMVDLTAEVADTKDEALRPGSFAEIVVPVSSERTAPVIPQTSIRPSDRGFIAFVVENGAAVERILNLGMRTADGQVEVLSGLKPGEMLVIRGSEALRDGVTVREGQTADAKPAPGAQVPAEKQ